MIIIDFNFVIAYITEFSEYRTIFGKDLNSDFIDKTQLLDKFYNLSYLKIYSSYRFFTVFLESIILAFRVFQFIGIFANFQLYHKFSNSLYRTSPVLLKFMFCLGIILIGWMLGFYLLFGDREIYFQTLTQSLLSFFVFDSSFLSNSEFFKRFAYSDNSSIYITGWLIFFCMKFIIFGYLLAIIRFSINKANNFEFETSDAKEENIRDCVNQITKKIDKFSKSYLNHLEAELLTNNKKMIIWLDNNLLNEEQYQDLMSLVNRLNINLIPFYKPQQILDFLQFLFRLKPNLLHKSANLFRILIENKEKIIDQVRNYDILFTEMILDWLRAVGCRVPVCFFMKVKINENDLMIIKKKYQNMIMTSSFDDVINFCCLKPLSNLMRKTLEINDSSFVSESEESRLIVRND